MCDGKAVVPRDNDLASHSPDLAKEWLYEKNAPLKPENVTAYSNRRVWWRCELGHEWRAVVTSRTKENCGCPYCNGKKVLPGFNDLKTLYPKVAKQWHPTLNAPLTPEQVSRASAKRVWWQCDLGHVWQTVVYQRTSQHTTGCPVCNGKTNEKN